MKHGLTAATLALYGLSAHAVTLDEVRARLWAEPQITIESRQAQFFGVGAVGQLDEYTIKFDRASNRLRLSYVREQPSARKARIEVWGARDCLHVMRIDSLNSYDDVRIHECVKASDLHRELDTGSAGEPAPFVVLCFLLDGNLLETKTSPARTELEPAHDALVLRIEALRGRPQTIARFDPAGTKMISLQRAEDSTPTRATFTTRTSRLSESDFDFRPSAEDLVLAQSSGQDDEETRRKLQALADKGSRRAEIVLRTRTMAKLMYGSRKDPVDVEHTWRDLERLGALGVSRAVGMQGAWLTKAEGADVPKQYQGTPKRERVKLGIDLIWKAARMCDRDSLELLQHGYMPRMPGVMPGAVFLQPSIDKMKELTPVVEQCDKAVHGPALARAAAEFADPFPR